MSQKRVAIVLASLIGTMTVSAATLLLMENGPLSTTPPAAIGLGASDPAAIRQLIGSHGALQTEPWNSIIVYESGDPAADAASLADGRTKGAGPSAGNPTRLPAPFHFIVDGLNSRPGVPNGALEVGKSWLNQERGTPFAGWPLSDPRYHTHPRYYKSAIGICLAGDLQQQPYSEAQVRILTQLIRELKLQHRIQRDALYFQWELDPLASQATPAQQAFAERIRKDLD